jgi:hypothetical protein
VSDARAAFAFSHLQETTQQRYSRGTVQCPSLPSPPKDVLHTFVTYIVPSISLPQSKADLLV